MKDGFVKVACASPRLRVADPAYNAEEIIRLIREAAEKEVNLLVLPELALTGKTCGDLLLQKRLLDECTLQLIRIAEATRGKRLLVLMGAPVEAYNGALYNAAVALFDGQIQCAIPKTNLTPAERRVFVPGESSYSFAEVEAAEEIAVGSFGLSVNGMRDLRIAVQIGRDPMPCHAATVIAHLTAEPEMLGSEETRRAGLLAFAKEHHVAVLSAGAASGESTTDAVYAGHDLIVEDGKLLAEFAPFEAEGQLLITEIDVEYLAAEQRRTGTAPSQPDDAESVCIDLPLAETVLTRPIDPRPFIPADSRTLRSRCRRMLQIQAEGLCRRLERARAAGMVIGISGGLDSCLALLVAVRAAERMGMDKKQILAVTMPCFGTTKRTRTNAEILCEELGVSFTEVSIAESVRVHFTAIGHDENDHSVVFENAQARERTQVIMDLANGRNALVVGTGDLSELALGWATYNGDHMSMYGVNASVPKTLVRYGVAVCALEAEEEGKLRLRDTLKDILDTPVSPELLPADGETIAQVTEDLVGPYELHDFFLYHLVRRGETPKKIFRLAKHAFAGAYEDGVILHWLTTFCRRFFTQQFKRSCLPDGPKVGTVSLSPRGDFSMPSDASFAAWMRELEELKETVG